MWLIIKSSLDLLVPVDISFLHVSFVFFNEVGPVFFVIVEVEHQVLQSGAHFDQLLERGSHDKVDEAQLRFGHVGRVSVAELGHLKFVDLLQVALSEELKEQQINPNFVSPKYFRRVWDIAEVKEKVEEHKFVFFVGQGKRGSCQIVLYLGQAPEMETHIRCQYKINHKPSDPREVVLCHLTSPIIARLQHQLKWRRDMVVFQNGNVIVSNRLWVQYLGEKYVVDPWMLEVVDCSWGQDSQVFKLVKLRNLPKPACGEIVIDRLNKVRCVRFVMVRHLLIASSYGLSKAFKLGNVDTRYFKAPGLGHTEAKHWFKLFTLRQYWEVKYIEIIVIVF